MTVRIWYENTKDAYAIELYEPASLEPGSPHWLNEQIYLTPAQMTTLRDALTTFLDREYQNFGHGEKACGQ